MVVKNLTLDGKRFVILSAKDYQRLRKSAGAFRAARGTGSQDARDAAEAARRLADASDGVTPYGEARRRLGLK